MVPQDEFKKYATKHAGISSLNYERYTSIYGNYISPTIIEERQMNIASMDVFFSFDDGSNYFFRFGN